MDDVTRSKVDHEAHVGAYGGNVEGGFVVGHGFGGAGEGVVSIEVLTEEVRFEASIRRVEVQSIDDEGRREESFGLEEKKELVAERDQKVFRVEGVEHEHTALVGSKRDVLAEHEHDERTHELTERCFGRFGFGFDREVPRMIQESVHRGPFGGAEVGSRSCARNRRKHIAVPLAVTAR